METKVTLPNYMERKKAAAKEPANYNASDCKFFDTSDPANFEKITQHYL